MTSVTSSHAPPTSSVMAVNKTISQLAQRYCVDCRSLFDELSRIIQKVIASRKELVEYDRQIREATLATYANLRPSQSQNLSQGHAQGVRTQASQDDMFKREEASNEKQTDEHVSRCYGCTTATVEHCITLLRALATNNTMRAQLCQDVRAYMLALLNLTLDTVASLFRALSSPTWWSTT